MVPNPNPNIALLVALVAAGAVILSAFINALSTIFTKWIERSNKNIEKIQDKQIANIEEMIAALDGFVKQHITLTYELQSTIASFRSFGLVFEADDEQFEVLIPKVRDDVVEAVTKGSSFLQASMEKVGELRRNQDEHIPKRAIWFRHDVPRLTVWLSEQAELRTAFNDLSKAYLDQTVELRRAVIRLEFKVCRDLIDLFRHNVESKVAQKKLIDVSEHVAVSSSTLRQIVKNNDRIVEETTALQKELILIYKGGSSSTGSPADSLLVATARRFETLFRRITNHKP